jgi:hypothetical protein
MRWIDQGVGLALLLAIVLSAQQAFAEESRLVDDWMNNQTKLGPVNLVFVGHHAGFKSRFDVAIWNEKCLVRQSIPQKAERINLFDGQNWIEHNLDNGRRIKRRPDQLASQLPFDPRTFVFQLNNRPILELLKESLVNSDSTNIGVYVPPGQRDRTKYNELRLSFDEEVGGLPTHSSLWLIDKELSVERKISEVDVSYCRLSNRDAYIPTIMVMQTFEGDSTSTTKYILVGVDLVKEPDENFPMSVPPDSLRLIDLTHISR